MQWTGQFSSKPGSICPGFYRLRYLAACPHGCAYCYLPGTYWRGRPRDITEADLPEMERAVEHWMRNVKCSTCGGYPHSVGTGGWLLNAGELSDSFAPEICAKASLRLIELFRRQHRHTLLLLTKARPTALFEVAPTPRVIVSFSLGQQVFQGQRIARAAPDGQALVEAAVRLLLAGWRVRLRLDPIIDQDGVDQIATLLRPVLQRCERITLGSLRFTSAGYRAVAHGSPIQRAPSAALRTSLAACVRREEGEAGTHPYRLPLAQRSALYAAVLEALKGRASDFALCKETPEAWRQTFGIMPEAIPCNCTP